MSVTIKSEPTLLQVGSHWLELEKTSRAKDEPFAKEELYPILELDAPRVGLVRARFEANRYVASSYDEKTGTSSPMWSEWRIFLRDVEAPDPERPELAHLGRAVAGVGDATRQAISAACLPLIEAWLESDAYRESRERAAAYAIAREIDAPADYKLTSAAETLARLHESLSPQAFRDFGYALARLGEARALLDAATSAGEEA